MNFHLQNTPDASRAGGRTECPAEVWGQAVFRHFPLKLQTWHLFKAFYCKRAGDGCMEVGRVHGTDPSRPSSLQAPKTSLLSSYPSCFIMMPLAFQQRNNSEKNTARVFFLFVRVCVCAPACLLWPPETTFCLDASTEAFLKAVLPPDIKYLCKGKPGTFAAAGWRSAGSHGEPDLTGDEMAGACKTQLSVSPPFPHQLRCSLQHPQHHILIPTAPGAEHLTQRTPVGRGKGRLGCSGAWVGCRCRERNGNLGMDLETEGSAGPRGMERARVASAVGWEQSAGAVWPWALASHTPAPSLLCLILGDGWWQREDARLCALQLL